MSTLRVPLGGGTLSFEAPPGIVAEVVTAPEVPVVPLAEAVERALAEPLGSPPLEELARGRRSAVICVPDATRPLAPAAALPPVLARLAAGGIPPDRVTILVGLGLHARPTGTQLALHTGAAELGGAAVDAHDPAGPMADLGPGPLGAPLRVARRLVETDLLLSFGWVEPHQYAGFSGGYKTAVIGCGSEETIGATHSPRFVDHPLCRPASIEGNPFQSALREAGRRAKLAFVVNAIPRGDGAAAAAAGDPQEVLLDLARRAHGIYAVFSGAPADAAVAGVKPPKDRNLYQASRAITNLVLGAAPAVREGGPLVLPALLPDGFGDGEGEKRFRDRIEEGVEAVLARNTEEAFRGGEQRAWVLARVLRHHPVILVGARSPERFARLPVAVAADMPEALEWLAARIPGGRLLVVPDAIGTFTARP